MPLFSNVVVLLLLASAFIAYKHRARRGSLPLPPGPKPQPFIGNLNQMPRKEGYKVFSSWGQIFGDLVYVHVFGRKFVILNSSQAAMDLFEKRGLLYSERPRLPMADLTGKSDFVLFHHYGERLKKHRQLLRTALSPQRCKDYWEMQYVESYKLLHAFIKTPDSFASLLRLHAGAVTLRLAYGYEVSNSGGDPFVNLAEELAGITRKVTEPGRWLVDSFPWLRHIPAWVPGAEFKRIARSARSISSQFAAAPYTFAKNNYRDGTGLHSFASECIELLESASGHRLTADEDEMLKWTTASIYSGGTDTLVAITVSFIRYMAAYPDVQRKAQAELDSVVGKDRLPTMEDQPRLPYIEALTKELHRFHPVTPLVPHSSFSDDEYRGYRIPKNSWIIANTWAMMHNAEEFAQPEKFWPERFLVEGGNCTVDPREYSYGYGRRRCPGYKVADAHVFLTVAHTLAAFTISLPDNKQAQEQLLAMGFADGHISHPEPFKCNIVPRSGAISDLITQLATSP